MAFPSISYRSSLSKMNVSKRSEMEALICQASGLAQIVIEKDLIDYQPSDPAHKTLWLLCDLVVRVEDLWVETYT